MPTTQLSSSPGDRCGIPSNGNNMIRLVRRMRWWPSGRPKGDRGSYKQWEEGGIAAARGFEVLKIAGQTPRGDGNEETGVPMTARSGGYYLL